MVNWKCRNGFRPEATLYHIKVIREKCPQLLIDLFLNQLNVIDPDQATEIPSDVIRE